MLYLVNVFDLEEKCYEDNFSGTNFAQKHYIQLIFDVSVQWKV